MKFFCAKNLTERTLVECCPWEFTPAEMPSAQIRGDKQSRQEWYQSVSTEWQFYTTVESANPNQRCAKTNPARLLHGLSADYDIPIPPERVLEAVKSMPIAPQWTELSLGGNIRLIWIFPRPIPVDDYHFCCFVLESAIDWLRLDLLPALDRGAFTDPARLLCNGAKWTPTNLPMVSETALQAFVVDCGRKHRFVGGDGVDIPIDVVEKAIRAKFPGFTWPGEFAVDTQGPSFWIPESLSTLSAIVKRDGMFTFSAHADKPFYPWAELIGAETVKEYTSDAITKATSDIWWDKKHFWRKKQNQYVSCDNAELMNFFKVNCRLSAKPAKDGVSMTDLALNHIWSTATIHGAAPFVFRPQGIINFMGKRVLNTYVNCVIRPAEATESKWGGQFPFLAALLDQLFSPPEQLPHFLAWWKHFYQSALNEIPAPGQNIFLMGGAGVGKTLTSRHIVGRSVGGFMDGSEHLTRHASFDSEMYEVGLWCIDDETMGESSQAQANFQAMLKKIAANQQFRHNKKFEVSIMTEWMGRAICTTNLDYVSSRALGSLDNTSGDKTCVFRCAATASMVFPERTLLGKIIDTELPHLLAWLVQFNPPDFVKRDVRYGYAAHHEPTLLNQAYQSSKVAPFKELLVEALLEYFRQEETAPEWRGTATQLIRLLHTNPLNEPVVRSLRLEQTSRYLEMIQREDLLNCTVELGPLKTRIWKFARFANPAEPTTSTPAAPEVPPMTQSIFQK